MGDTMSTSLSLLWSCSFCTQTFHDRTEAESHINGYKISAQYHLRELQQALLHQEAQVCNGDYTTFLPDRCDILRVTSNRGHSGNESFKCPHVSCEGKAIRYRAKRNLERHYSNHILINEKCPYCLRLFRNLRSFTYHCEQCKKQLGQNVESEASQKEVKRRMKSLRTDAARKLDRECRSRTRQSLENRFQPSLLPDAIPLYVPQIDPIINPEGFIQPAEIPEDRDSRSTGYLFADQLPAENTSLHQHDTLVRAPLLASFTIIEPTTLNQDAAMVESMPPPYDENGIQVPPPVPFHLGSSQALMRAPLLATSTIIGSPNFHDQTRQMNQASTLSGHKPSEVSYDMVLGNTDHVAHFLQTFPSSALSDHAASDTVVN